MKRFYCEEISCGHCVNRIGQALTQADIGHEIDLEGKIVAIEGGSETEAQAVELLDDLGFSAKEI